MAIRSGFFNSINKDRLYSASNFAEYFATFISNGVFPNPSTNLQVMANNDMTVTVQAGKAWINGYILINDDDYILELDAADGVLNRIDRVVARYDVVDREIRLEVKQGDYATNAVVKELQRDADAYELGLADITVNAGVISISQSNITDLRLNNNLCGIVHGTVEQVDTTTLFNQYLTWLQEKKTQYNNDMINWTSQKQAEFEDWTTAQEQDFENWRIQEEQNFNTWFASIEDILDENAATTILNMIGDLSNLTTTDKSSLVSAINELDDELTSHKNDYVALVDRVNNLNTNDIQARKEILDIKLKLDEQQVIEFLNKTGIGFFDLFEDSENIDIANTTAVVDTAVADVIFNGQQTLKMKPQTFDNFNTLELALYYKGELKTLEMENNVSNSAQIDMMISPGSIAVGEKYYYNGEVYTVIGVQEV
jgi:arsenate reductase-like glutaredoxin family protein